MVRSSAFHVAFRVLLIGVSLSILAVAALPLLTLPSDTRVAIVDQGAQNGNSATAPPAPSPGRLDSQVALATDRPKWRGPLDDHRRIASAEAVPGVFGESSTVPTLGKAPKSDGALVDHSPETHSRPVPPPQFAEAPVPARSASAPFRSESPVSIPRPLSEVPESSAIAGPPRAFPAGRSLPDAAPVTPELPTATGPDLLELRREVGRLAESHLQDQRTEIQKAQLVLSEMQNAKQIELLRSEIRTLRDEQAEIRSAALAPPAPQPEKPPETLPVPAPHPVSQPTGVHIERTADPTRYTVRLRGATLGTAVNELAVLAGWNVVTGDEFSQVVTATLTDVTAEEAVEALLQSHGWEIRREGRRLLIDRPQSPILDDPAPTEATLPVPMPVGSVPPVSASVDIAPMAIPQDLQTQSFALQHVSASEVLPQIEGLLTPGVGSASREAGPEPATTDVTSSSAAGFPGGRPVEDRIIVRDRPENLEQLASVISSLDLPQIDIDVAVLLVERREKAAAGVRRGLATYLASLNQPNQICPRCGRRHPAAAPAGPACTLPEPAWTIGGPGWEFAQLRGTPDEFADVVRRFTSVEVLLRQTVRVRHDEATGIDLRQLMKQRTLSYPSRVAQIVDGGQSLREETVSIRPHSLASGEIRMSIAASSVTPDDANPSENPGADGTDIVVQKECSLVMAGVQADAERSHTLGTSRFELVLLLTPRQVAGPVRE